MGKLHRIDLDATAESIDYWLMRRDITPKELAEVLDVSRASVYYWLAGKTIPTIENVAFMMQIFGCDFDEIIKFAD